MNTDDKLSEVFDVEPISKIKHGDLIISDNRVIPATTDETLDQDYNTTRSNLHTLLQQGQDALYHALEVAKQSEHPRAFEVVGNLMRNLSDINHQLLDLHQKKQSLQKPTAGEEKKSSQSGGVTNNAIFVGSTSELSKMLSELKKGS